MAEPSTDQPHTFPEGHAPGEMLFSTLPLIFAAALLAALPWQTASLDGTGFAAQPRFWPVVSLAVGTLFAALHRMMRAGPDRTAGRGRAGWSIWKTRTTKAKTENV